MNKISSNSGYSLLFVLLTISALTLYCLALFRSSFYAVSIPSLQNQKIKYSYLSEGLINYGIAFCTENKAMLFSDVFKKDIVLSAKQWPPIGTSIISGTLTIHPLPDGNSCTLQVQLLSSKTIVYTTSCLIKALYQQNEEAKEFCGIRIADWNSSNA